MPKKKPSEHVFVLYDKKGNMLRTLTDNVTALEIALDHRFSEKLTVRTYKLLKRREEPRGVPVSVRRVD